MRPVAAPVAAPAGSPPSRRPRQSQQKGTSVYNEATLQYKKEGRDHSAHKWVESTVQSTHRCCAERRLLGSWIVEARKRGLRNHQIVTWVRRKVGPDIMVWRYHGDGLLACATPCLFCARELQRFDMRVHCSQGDETWFSGRLHEEQAPEARPTAGQIRTIFRPQRKNQERQQRVSTKRPVPVHVPDWLERPPNQAQGQRQSSKSSKRGSSKER